MKYQTTLVVVAAALGSACKPQMPEVDAPRELSLRALCDHDCPIPRGVDVTLSAQKVGEVTEVAPLSTGRALVFVDIWPEARQDPTGEHIIRPGVRFSFDESVQPPVLELNAGYAELSEELPENSVIPLEVQQPKPSKAKAKKASLWERAKRLF